MKYKKPRQDLIYVLNPILALGGLLLFCFFLNDIPCVFYAFWFATAVALFLILSPFGNIRLAKNSDGDAQRLPWQQWIFCILLLELTLLGAYLGVCFINGQALLIYTPNNPILFSQTIQTELLHYGLFPWSLYAIIAVGMGVLAYRQNTHAYFSNLLKPLTEDEPDETLGLIINVSVRRCTFFAIGISLLFMAMLFVSLFLPLGQYIVHGFHIPALITSLIFICASFSTSIKRYMRQFFSLQKSTALSFPVFSLLLGLAILILGIVATQLTKKAAPPALSSLIRHWINFNHTSSWSLFSVFWWLFFIPLACGFIARISKGYKIRQILIGILALPVLITIYFLYASQLNMNFSLSPATTKIMSLVSFLILLPLLLNQSTVSQAIEAYFPIDGIAKHRDQSAFFEKTIQLTFVFTYLYLVIGINALSLFFFVLNALFATSMILIPIAIVKNITCASLHKAPH
ncbi:MAG: BCCT family transporter [Gammaproteobacteria bacterium]|nr:BCCT family transporter [Gammaproteobacteria bacterium]